MEKEELELLSKAYAPIIDRIIKDNVRFYRFERTIYWRFTYDERDSIMATTNRNNNVISINLKSVMRAYAEKDLKTIEYFLLHEIRHVFQHLIIADYKNEEEISISKEIVEKWIGEQKNYVQSLDENGKENKEYFLQDSEMDAYAFSYAVMKYKYKNVNLYIPPVYGNEFWSIVDEFISVFTEEKL